jgi:DNA mismatch endonuclease (patch repair protein)
MMQGIRGKNTRPEIAVRKALFAAGYRFRLHRRDLPGAPDVVLPSRKVAIFVHGCFWHMHRGCRLARTPTSRSDFWKNKLEGNARRDLRSIEALMKLGWRTLIVWECFIRAEPDSDSLKTALSSWINGGAAFGQLSGSL